MPDLLTAEAVMGPDEVMTQDEAWRAYDRWLQDERVDFLAEPAGLESSFRAMTQSPRAAPKDWADSYLAAFAVTSQLTLVTFDQGFQSEAKQLVLLKAQPDPKHVLCYSNEQHALFLPLPPFSAPAYSSCTSEVAFLG